MLISFRLEGVHVLQRHYGCEWDDESDITSGYEEYSYDGEDFISLDLNNMRWVAVKPQAVLTRNKWDTYESSYSSRTQYFTQDCPDWLKKYVQYGNSYLRRKGTAAHTTLITAEALLQRAAFLW